MGAIRDVGPLSDSESLDYLHSPNFVEAPLGFTVTDNEDPPTSYSSVFIDLRNNGRVFLDEPVGSGWISPFECEFTSTNNPVEASSSVAYGNATVEGVFAWVANWTVTHISGEINLHQLIIYDQPSFAFEYNVDQAEHLYQSAAGSGWNFTPAFSAGNGADLLDSSPDGLIHHLLNSEVLGRYVYAGPPDGAFGDCVFGEGVFGNDCSENPPEPTNPPVLIPGHSGCVCGENWRFEATDFATGRVKAVLHPISIEWEDNYTSPGVGSMLVATKDYSIDDIWPNTTGIYISRVNPDGTRIPHWGGYVEAIDGDDGGSTAVGLKSIDNFLFKRLIADANGGTKFGCYVIPAVFPIPVIPQTGVATALVNLARTRDGVPLIPIDGGSTVSWRPCWQPWDVKNIGEAIQAQVQSANGLRYHLEHEWLGGYWVTRMVFTDSWGTDRKLTLKSDREGWRYSLQIDGKDEASRVYGIGSGEGAQQLQAVAFDEDALSPELHATQAWKDTTSQTTLGNQTVGWLADHRDPVATPAMTIAGMEPDPETLLSGDIVDLDIGYGLLTFEGKARITSQAWKLNTEEPVNRTLSFLPIIRSSQGLRLQKPKVAPKPKAPIVDQITPAPSPWPVAGKWSNIQPDELDEVSGMAQSKMRATAVWVHNDENNDPQVILIEKSGGKKIGSFTPSGPARIDPESIKVHLQQGRVILADIGDNDNNRANVKLYAVTEPGVGDKGTLPATVYTLTYPFGSKNAECFMINPVTGEWLIATKESSGRLVSFGTGAAPVGAGTLKASGLPAGISDGDITRNGKFALFTTEGHNFVTVVSTSTWKKIGEIPIPAMSKCEAITIESTCSFLVTTEGENPPIYRVLIPTMFGATCADVPPDSGGGGGTSPTAVPGQVLNLTNWKLTLPI